VTRLGSEIRIAAFIDSGTPCDALLAAINARQWQVTLTDSLDDLCAKAESGRYHMALAATCQPRLLPRAAARNLLSMQTDLAVLFLIPEAESVLDSPALRGTTSDQVLRLETDPAAFVETLSQELISVDASQPRYQVMCVDDDVDFLASLESLLPPHLEKAFPRFRLDFAFFDSPVEAVASLRDAAGRLALVISDQVMPQIKGIDLLRQVKELVPDAQRALLTGYASLDSAITAMNEQVLDKYLTKPIEEPADFVNTAEHLLRSYHLRRTRNRQRIRVMAQFEFIRAVTAAANAGAAGRIVCDFLQEQLAAPQAAIVLRDGEHVVVCAAAGAAAAWPGGVRLSLRPEFVAPAAMSFRPRLAGRPDELPWVSEEGAVDLPVLWMPLNWSGANLGFVLLSRPSGLRTLSRDERMLTSFVADIASVTCGGLKEREALERLYLDTMSSLMEAVEAKDEYTRGHTDRVKDYALLLARAAGADEAQLKEVEYAAALHDIGKIGVPDSIVTKQGRLNDEELALMKGHCDRGDRILQPLSFLDRARHSVRSHHERYDGRGYPDGLSGQAIPFVARILAIADSYDAMTSVRPYRDAMDPRDALAEIEVHSGSQFDPSLAAIFVKLMRDPLLAKKISQPDDVVATSKEKAQ
jgi:response regulator RpfG family c-di-GMP phosphodiesterase